MPAKWRANRGTALNRESGGEESWMSGRGNSRTSPIGPFPTPACIAQSPRASKSVLEKAISKRTADGIVVVNQARCIGCRSCAEACPFHVPQYGKAGVMQKCDLCLDRLGQGKQPSCAATCPGEALKFGVLEDLAKMAAAKSGEKLPAATAPAFFISGRMKGTVFLSVLQKDTAFLNGGIS